MSLIFILIPSVPVVLSSASGFVFSLLMPGIGTKWAMLVGAAMGVAVVGAGFGFVSALDEITRTVDLIWYPSEETWFSSWVRPISYFWERHLDAILFGTYAAAIVLGRALTGLACFLRKPRVTPLPGK
ncbi:MAG: hypothetical protein OXN21_07805 [Chloroflexota bacterium]|nr:hypothetical protein [Chloroflexota bacterium]